MSRGDAHGDVLEVGVGTVTATCVFCSVDDPVRGLEEVRRDGIWREIVARPGLARS